jgi:hypothetical protein
MARKSESRIVEAVGAATGGSNDLSAADIQNAMDRAAADAQAEGITDPDVIRDRKLAARKAVKEKARG